MNRSYQTALIAAVVFCVAVLGYFLTKRSSFKPDAAPQVAPAADMVEGEPVRPPLPPPTPAVTDNTPAPKPTDTTPSSKPPTTQPAAADVDMDVKLNDTPPTFTLNNLNDPPATNDLNDGLMPDPALSDIDAAAAAPLQDEPVQPDPPATSSSRFRQYTVRAGDTFTSIATAQYGSDRYWYDIAQANPLADPLKLRPGDVINLPDLSAITAKRNRTHEFSSGPVEYLVRPGDNLEAIAVKHYNDASLWRDIYRANRTRIGPNPDRIQVGMKLVIPPAPRQAR